MLGIGLGVLAIQQGGSSITPGPDQAVLALADYKNGVYSIDGASKVQGDLFEHNADYDSSNPLLAPVTDEGLVVATNTGFASTAALNDVILAAGCTMVINLTDAGASSSATFELVDLPDFNQDFAVSVSALGGSDWLRRLKNNDQRYELAGADLSATSQIEVLMTPTLLALSLDSGPTMAFAPSDPSAFTNFGFQFADMTVEDITFYEPALPLFPVNTALPVITGTAQIGQTLTCSTGDWDNDPTNYHYQWYQSDSFAIDGATDSTYLVQAGDDGVDLNCRVIAENAEGTMLAVTALTDPVVE